MLTHLLNNASRTKLSSSRTQYSSNTSTKSFVSSKKPLHKNYLVVQKICLAIKKNIVFLLSLDGRVFFSTVFTRFSLEESKDETSARLGLSSAMFSRDDQGRIFRSAMQNSFVSWLARANWGPPPDRIHYHIRHGVTQSKHFRRGIYLSTIFNGKEVLYSAFFGHLWHSTDARSS